MNFNKKFIKFQKKFKCCGLLNSKDYSKAGVAFSWVASGKAKVSEMCIGIQES